MTSHPHSPLSILMAIALGGLLVHTLGGSEAVGYPAGPVVSAGSNPVFSTGGGFSFSPDTGTTMEVLTAPADQDLVVTDVGLAVSSGHTYCGMRGEIDLYVDGESVAAFTPMSPIIRFSGSETAFLRAGNTVMTFSSGIRVPAGSTLTIEASLFEWGGSYCSSSYTQQVRYTLSGYQAQP